MKDFLLYSKIEEEKVNEEFKCHLPNSTNLVLNFQRT